MVLKRGFVLLAVVAALTSIEATSEVHVPAVKQITKENGQFKVMFEDAPKTDVKKEVKETTAENGDTVRKYPFGSVRIRSGKKTTTKKVKKSDHQVKIEHGQSKKGKTDVVKDISLKEGDEVDLDFGKHHLSVELQKEGTLLLHADKKTYKLPNADDIDIQFDGNFKFVTKDEEASGDVQDKAKHHAKKHVKKEQQKKNEETQSVKKLTTEKKEKKKEERIASEPVPESINVQPEDTSFSAQFTQFASELTGEEFFSKKDAPIVFACTVLGVVAIVAGLIAIVVGRRSRRSRNSQSVLTDMVDPEADVSESTVDAVADSSEDLADPTIENKDEEGDFENGVATV